MVDRSLAFVMALVSFAVARPSNIWGIRPDLLTIGAYGNAGIMVVSPVLPVSNQGGGFWKLSTAQAHSGRTS